MRLFGYYALHSTWNQIRKLFKSWLILFILACGIIGGVIGYSASRIEDISEETHAESVVEDVFEEDTEAALSGIWGLTVEDGLVIYDDQEEIYLEWAVKDLVELGLFAVILFVFVYDILSADKNGSKIFLMADVNLLFSAPMKPQSVLLFRILCQIGTAVLATFWLSFQIPNLVLNLGVSIPACCALLLVWFVCIIVGKLVQVFFYTVCTTKAHLKKYLAPVIWTLVVLCLLPALLTARSNDIDYLTAAIRIYNAAWTRWIPIVGWMKGLCMYVYESSFLAAAVLAVLLLIGSILLTILIWSLKADFYEDAMAQSEQTAQVMNEIQERGGVLASRRKKDRSEKLHRDRFRHGYGANVFFTRSMYNRFRFAPLGILTKTTITYLGVTAAVLTIGMLRDSMNFLYLALTLCVFIFYRAMGNPLDEDVEMSFYIMIPEPMWKKLFYSLAAGTANCILDLIPAMLVGAVVTRTSPVTALGWLILMLSMDVYGSVGSGFISLAIPSSASPIVKQIILVMYIYFGLVPDALIIALGIASDHFFVSALAVLALNLALASIFFALMPLYLEPRAGIRPDVPLLHEELRLRAKKTYSMLGLGGALILALDYALVRLLYALVSRFAPAFLEQGAASWILTFVPLYLCAIPAGIYVMRRIPASEKVEGSRFSLGQLLTLFVICIGLLYSGNLIGTLLNRFLGLFLPVSNGQPLMDLVTDDQLAIRILVIVILAPVLEETVFRKLLIDRMRKYGEGMAILTSALMFGLFHGNFSQFFYATGLGLVFGYIYLRSGKLRYSICFHMLINFLGSVASVWLLEQATSGLELMDQYLADGFSLSQIPLPVIAFFAYVLVMIVTAVIGLVLLCLNLEKLTLQGTTCELGKGQRFRTIWLNPGMLLFLAGCIAMFVISLL